MLWRASAGRRREALAPAALAAVWLAVVVLVDPRGNFPLNDDWCYALAVRHLLDTGELRLTDWGSMALLTQVLWGALFSLVAGFSFETLRASTLVLGLVGLLACYGTCRELHASRALALLTTLALLSNPLFLVLAHTFMTDVPFLALSMTAIFLVARGFERDSRPALVSGLLIALAATFVRQLGLALFVGFAFGWLSQGWLSGRRWVMAWAPAAGALVLLRVYEAWLASKGSLPENYYLQWRLIRDDLRAGALEMAAKWLATGGEIAIYLGLFVLPLAGVWMLRRAGRDGARLRFIVLAAATLGTAVLVWRGGLMPYFPNILLHIQCDPARIVLGPLTLRDGCVAANPGLGAMTTVQRAILTWLGLTGVVSLAIAGLTAWIRPRRAAPPLERGRAAIVMIVATAASYLALVALLFVFDRYVLYAVPLVLVLFTVVLRDRPAPRRSLVLGWALAMGSLVWSIGAAQEYLDWNRARWRALAYLMEDIGADRGEIDGGFEFGGWVNFDARHRGDLKSGTWWVRDDYYVVAFEKLDGHQLLGRFPYRGWFGWVENDVLALRRRADTPQDRRPGHSRPDHPRRRASRRDP